MKLSLGKTLFTISILLLITFTAFETLARIPIIPIRLFIWFIIFTVVLLGTSLYLIYKEEKEKKYTELIERFKESRK